MERKTLIRLLIVVAIGVPLLVEAATFAGMVDQQFGGDGGDGATTTTAERGVGVGDDLLPDTVQAERVTAATIYAGDEWRFRLTVLVNNTGDRPYSLRVGPLRTTDGERVEGSIGTERLSPGESTTLTATWTIPSGASPAAVSVKAFTYGNETGVTTAEIRLASPPVRYDQGP